MLPWPCESDLPQKKEVSILDYRSLHMKTVADLRKLAKELHVKVPAGTP